MPHPLLIAGDNMSYGNADKNNTFTLSVRGVELFSSSVGCE